MKNHHIHKRIYRGFSIGSTMNLSTQTLQHLTRTLFSWNTATIPAPLDGRAAVEYTTLPETGPVVIKSYQRGGLVAKIIKEHYLKTGKTRCQKEFDFLNQASMAGISVPQPLIYISRGYPFYRAWLITQRIKNHRSFTRIAMENPTNAAQFMPSISKQVRLLIKNNIFHVDLHPGNILIDAEGNPYIIDFDRARMTHLSPKKMIRRLQTRWEKALLKYHLPSTISNLALD